MNVTLPEKEKLSVKDKVMYIVAAVVCFVSLISIIIFEISSGTSINEILDKTLVEGKELGIKTEDEKETLKTEFDKKFTNGLEKNAVSANIKKIDNMEDIIYPGIDIKEDKEGSYAVNVILPTINIDSEVVNKFNAEIEQAFKKKLDDVLKTEDKDIKYSTNYTASINENILSLAIKSNLKEGNNVQRTIVKTYNYDIKEDRKISLSELLARKNLDENTISENIKKEIEKAQERVEGFKEVGYSVYNRNSSDSMYKIEKSEQFYYSSNTIYIIYPYGNEQYTSEMDIVVI